MTNVKSDVAFFIGNDTVDTNPVDMPDTPIHVNEKEVNNKEESNGTLSNLQNNIINFATPKPKGTGKKRSLSSRFGSSKTMEFGHSESTQTMSLLNPSASSTNTISDGGTSKKSRYSGKRICKI